MDRGPEPSPAATRYSSTVRWCTAVRRQRNQQGQPGGMCEASSRHERLLEPVSARLCSPSPPESRQHPGTQLRRPGPRRPSRRAATKRAKRHRRASRGERRSSLSCVGELVERLAGLGRCIRESPEAVRPATRRNVGFSRRPPPGDRARSSRKTLDRPVDVVGNRSAMPIRLRPRRRLKSMARRSAAELRRARRHRPRARLRQHELSVRRRPRRARAASERRDRRVEASMAASASTSERASVEARYSPSRPPPSRAAPPRRRRSGASWHKIQAPASRSGKGECERRRRGLDAEIARQAFVNATP